MDYLTGFLIGVCLMLVIERFIPYKARHKPKAEQLTEEEQREQKKVYKHLQGIGNYDINQAYRGKSE